MRQTGPGDTTDDQFPWRRASDLGRSPDTGNPEDNQIRKWQNSPGDTTHDQLPWRRASDLGSGSDTGNPEDNQILKWQISPGDTTHDQLPWCRASDLGSGSDTGNPEDNQIRTVIIWRSSGPAACICSFFAKPFPRCTVSDLLFCRKIIYRRSKYHGETFCWTTWPPVS